MRPTPPADYLLPQQLCRLVSRRYPLGVLVKVRTWIAGTSCYRVELAEGTPNRFGERPEAYALRSELSKLMPKTA